METDAATTDEDLTLSDGDHSFDSWFRMIRDDVESMTAGAFPVKPPSAWFEDPGFKELTPLTITSAGQVHGHIAGWKTSHIGLAGGVKPPKSKSHYSFFKTGRLETAEGDMVDVGQITLSGGHAPLEASVSEAVAHYDNTKSALMDVAAGEDRHGIWVAGALRPDVTDEQLRAMRASSVSGDWRPINGRLELVAVCAVNCPGFPIPRARVAGGAPLALTAAGTAPIVEKILASVAGPDEQLVETIGKLNERLQRVESIALDAAQPVAASGKNTDVEIERVRRSTRRTAGRLTQLERQLAVIASARREELDTDVEAEKSGEDHSALVASLRERRDAAKADQLRRRVRPAVA